MGANSTFLVKNSTNVFPITFLRRFLEVRHANRPAGHWSSMAAVISEVTVMEIACTWSQRYMSYFVPTCRSTEAHEVHEENHPTNF